MERPNKLPLVKLVVSSDEGSRGDDLVAHLLECVEHIEGGRCKLHTTVFLVPPLGGGGGLLCQDTELVQGQAIHRAAAMK